ncbi:MAG: acetoin utilization protein AcuB [Thermotogota bacterium]|nr:acetoin utilization protein AcuB [Thermotogota bacterium]MDK2864675.1 acetoin utilization protein AcuB [Thermotogota bacterium]HCZ06183.1 hypothetical protein [Thermotogota bacterium]
MRVGEWMERDFPRFEADLKVLDIKAELQALEIPLVIAVDEEGKLVGIANKFDILEAPKDKTLRELVHFATHVVSEDSFVEDAIVLLTDSREFALPVVDESMRVLGALTVFEVLEFLMEMTAIGEKGCRLSLLLEDVPGALKRVVDVLVESDINILSILTYPEGENKHRVVLRVDTLDADHIRKMLDDAGIEYDSVIPEEGFGE